MPYLDELNRQIDRNQNSGGYSDSEAEEARRIDAEMEQLAILTGTDVSDDPYLQED